MKKFFQKYFALILVPTIFFGLGFVSVFAQESEGDNVLPEDVSSNFGLEPIKVPFFDQLDIGTAHSTIFTWIGFALSIFTVFIVGYWIYRIVRATITAMRSDGDPEKLGGARGSIKSVFTAAGLSILFPVLLSIIGVLIGAGTIFNWPKAFRGCREDSQYTFYFKALLATGKSIRS